MAPHKHPPDDVVATVKTTEAQQLLLEVENKNTRMRAIGLILLLIVSIGVIAAVVLAAIIYQRQDDDRKAEAMRREKQAETGNQILENIYVRLNHADKLLSEHVGQEPLPPLVLPTTTTIKPKQKTVATSVGRTTTTTARPVTTTSSSTTPSTSTSTSTTTTQPPTTTTTSPGTCVGPFCVRGGF